MNQRQFDATAKQPQLTRDEVRLFQRLHKLPRGTTHLMTVTIPEQLDKPMTWSVLAVGKVENDS